MITTGAIGSGPIGAGPIFLQTGGASTFGGGAIALASVTGALTTGLSLGGPAVETTAATGALTNWTNVTLVAPLYTGFGGVLDPTFWIDSKPVAGTTLYYDSSYITIQPNGEIVAARNPTSAAVQFFDGTSWAFGIISVTPTMVGNATAVNALVGALTATSHWDSAATSLVQASGILTTQIRDVGNAVEISVAAAALNTAIRLAGAAVSTSAVSASLNSIALSSVAGDLPVHSTLTGVLTTALTVASSAVSVVSAAGALAAKIQLAAQAISTNASSAFLRTGGQMQANAISAAVAAGNLLNRIGFAGPAAEITTAAGALSTNIKLLTDAISGTTVGGILITKLALGGAPAALDVAVGRLTALTRFMGVAWATARATGTLTTTPASLRGAAVSGSVVTAELLAPGSPIGLYVFDAGFYVDAARVDFTQTFKQIGNGEGHVLTFNYGDDLVGNELLEGIIHVTVECTTGVDATPAAILNGPPAYDSTRKMVMQPVIGTIAGNIYYLTVTAPTTNPQKILYRFGLLPVVH